MRVHDGQDRVPTKMGSACSILLFVLLLAYSGHKLNVLIEKSNVDITEAVQYDYFDHQYVFGAEQGLNLAFAVVNPINPDREPELDPRYGSIKFSAFQFGQNKKGKSSFSRIELESRFCSDSTDGADNFF